MTIYYVNYATGSDANAGTSPTAAWKHAPGDSNATGKVVKASLVGGDEVLFKGGVTYYGEITEHNSGTPGKPIVYEGTGWGGTATLSGLTTVPLNFTVDPSNPKRSVATLPAGMVPKGMASEVESALSDIVEIDGKVSYVSNDSSSTSPYFPETGWLPYAASDMQGSGSSWTLTGDSALTSALAAANPTVLSNMAVRMHKYGNVPFDMTPTAYNASTNALSLSGNFAAPGGGTDAATIYNDPDFVSSSNPYSEYAVEGNQIYAAVTPGVHAVSVSTVNRGIWESGISNMTVDGFNLTGYGSGDGRAIAFSGPGQNITITNNTVSNDGSAVDYGLAAITACGITNLTISGNTIGPGIALGAGITVACGTNNLVTGNTINSVGWTGIVAFDEVNSTISLNRISNLQGVHATGIIAYDVHSTLTATGGQESRNVDIINNQITNCGMGIGIEGDLITHMNATPNNFNIAYNVIDNATTWGISDWGYTNGATIHGNIVTTGPTAFGPLSLFTSSKNVLVYDNVLHGFPYISPTQTADTFTHNLSLWASDKNMPKTGGNLDNASLASVLQTALTSGGMLPWSLASILRPTGAGAIGIDYTTVGSQLASVITPPSRSGTGSVTLSPLPSTTGSLLSASATVPHAAGSGGTH